MVYLSITSHTYSLSKVTDYIARKQHYYDAQSFVCGTLITSQILPRVNDTPVTGTYCKYNPVAIIIIISGIMFVIRKRALAGKIY